MGKFAGGKMAGSHTTAIPAANPIIKAALTQPEVSKIILGPIQTGKQHGAARLKIIDTDAGLDCTIRGNTGLQKFFVYTSDRHATASALHAVAPKPRGKTKKRARKDEDPPLICPVAKVPIRDWTTSPHRGW